MFAVPGWSIRADSLVTEKPSTKANKSKAAADPHVPNKRKRPQWEEAEDGHLLDANELEKRWNQRFGGQNANPAKVHKGDLAQATERKTGRDPIKSSSRGTTVASNAKPGNQEPRESQEPQKPQECSISSGNNNNANAGLPHSREGKLSRKQKKLLNKKQREQQASEAAASDSIAEGAPVVGAKLKDPRKRESDSHVLQGGSESTCNGFDASATPRAISNRKGKSVLQDGQPNQKESNATGTIDSLNISPQPPVSPAPTGLPAATVTSTVSGASSAPVSTKLTALQSKFAAKLTSARFRHLNQQLYTTRSKESLELFKSQPSLFTDYHLGFTQQTQSWPVNPVNTFIAALQKRQDLPRRKTGSCTVADLGCGDAPLARALAKGKAKKKLGLQIHSFDLHAVNEHVAVADMSSLPLRDGEADIAIFCLALMGTNWLDFVEECWRILRGDGKGEVWVAEVKSRFVSHAGRRAPGQAVDNSVGKKRRRITTQKSKLIHGNQDEDDNIIIDADGGDVLDDAATANDTSAFSAFVSVFERRGFKLKAGSIDSSNKMFVSMTFYKSGVPVAGKHKGLKWNGKEYQNQKQQNGKMKTKFIGGADSDDDDVDPKDEAAVLKPCVYKTR